MSLDCPPPTQYAWTAPLPNFPSVEIIFTLPDRFFDHGEGQSRTLMFFSKSVTYQPTLSKFRGGPVKKKHPVCLRNTSSAQADIWNCSERFGNVQDPQNLIWAAEITKKVGQNACLGRFWRASWQHCQKCCFRDFDT